MAWINPKTDWAAADGVRNTDLNRIEGNIAFLQPQSAVTVYVSTTGNDSTGNGSSGSPYRTITKALSTLNKNMNGLDYTIQLTGGTYAEAVNIRGFVGGALIFSAASNVTVTLNSLTIHGCSLVSFTGFITLAISAPFALRVTGKSNVSIQNTLTCASSGGYTAVACQTGSSIDISTCNVTGYSTGIECMLSGAAYIGVLNGSGMSVGMSATSGGTVSFFGNNASATVRFRTDQGGRIYSGSQASIPNY